MASRPVSYDEACFVASVIDTAHRPRPSSRHESRRRSWTPLSIALRRDPEWTGGKSA